MTIRRNRDFLNALLIFLGGLFLFNVGLCHKEIIGFESRFYLFAQEMWRHGPSWFPTVYDAPYPDYPATTTFFIYLLAKAVGHLDKWVAVFPSSLCAAITLAITYLLGQLYDKKLGWCAAGFLLLTNTFFIEARTISPDQYITMVTTLCFYLAYSAQKFKKQARLSFIPFLLLFGFACRGPIGLVIPAGVLCIYYLTENNVKAFLLVAFGSLLLIAMNCFALFSIAYHVGGHAFMQKVLQMQIAGRLEHAQLAWYFYFVESFAAYALSYPLMVLMLPGLFLKKDNNKFLQKLLGWVFVILIGMSIPAGKKVRYVMAMSPALALLAGYLFALPQHQKYLLTLKKICYWLIYFFPWICLCLVLIADVYLSAHLKIQTMFAVLMLMLIALQWMNYLLRRKEAYLVGSAALVFALLVIGLQEPIDLALNRTRNFVHQIELARNQEQAKLVFYREDPDGLPIKYIVNMNYQEKPIFIDSVRALNAIVTPAFFITDASDFAQLPKEVLAKSRVIFTGELGHDKVVVFKKNASP